MNRWYIIDGFNLINSDNELKKLSKESKNKSIEKFLYYLNAYAKEYKNFKFTVVFDGYLNEVYSSLKNVYLEESHHFEADQIIKDYVKNAVKPKEIYVVSSDREVYSYARVNNANIYYSEEFIDLIKYHGEVDLSDLDYNKQLSYELEPGENLLHYFSNNPLDEDFVKNQNFKQDDSQKIKPKEEAKKKKVSPDPEEKNIDDDEVSIKQLKELKDLFESGIESKKRKKKPKLNTERNQTFKDESDDKDYDEFLDLFTK